VAGDAAALLDPGGAGGEIELVVHHQDFLGLDLKNPASICTRGRSRS